MKSFSKLSIVVVALLTLSACGTLKINESDVTNTLVNNMSKEWKGNLLSSDDDLPVEYSLSINSVSADFLPGGEFHDVDLRLTGRFLINTEPFLADTPVEIIIGSHADINEENATLNLTNAYVKEIIFPKLYQSYSQDLIVPVQESISNISNGKLNHIALMAFSKEKAEIAEYVTEKEIGDYTLVKDNNGKSIEIQFNTFKEK